MRTRGEIEESTFEYCIYLFIYLFIYLGQRPLVSLLLLGPPLFYNYSFRVHHLVNRDDRHLLAHAMASDFSVTWQCLSKRTIGLLLNI
jgi:hypothetical protein